MPPAAARSGHRTSTKREVRPPGCGNTAKITRMRACSETDGPRPTAVGQPRFESVNAQAPSARSALGQLTWVRQPRAGSVNGEGSVDALGSRSTDKSPSTEGPVRQRTRSVNALGCRLRDRPKSVNRGPGPSTEGSVDALGSRSTDSAPLTEGLSASTHKLRQRARLSVNRLRSVNRGPSASTEKSPLTHSALG